MNGGRDRSRVSLFGRDRYQRGPPLPRIANNVPEYYSSPPRNSFLHPFHHLFLRSSLPASHVPLPLPSQVPKSKTFFRGRNERVAESRCGRLAPRGEFTFLARRNRHDPSARFNARVISSNSRRLLCTIARLFAWQLVLERRGTTWEVIVSR